MMKHSEEFKQEAVRIALTSGLSRERVAKDWALVNRRWASGFRNTGRLIC